MQEIQGSSQTLHVYNVYAPTALEANAAATIEFYRLLNEDLESKPHRDMLIIAGDHSQMLRLMSYTAHHKLRLTTTQTT